MDVSISRCTYHVFLSFRGADTRKNFTDHLYMALEQAGIHTFRDNENIERGKNIKDEIEKAILHKSKISVVVFSKDYASSTWCLNELLKIVERRNSSDQHIILPVFYDVDPTQVKKQTGRYAEAFARHEENFKSNMDIVKGWRTALKEVADLGGMVLQDRHESQLIQDIVKEIQNKLNRTALYVPPFLVGINSLLKRINWWLEEDELKKVGIAIIHGIGGIGKTTVAKVIYNQNIQRFEAFSFLANIRETSEECNGLVHLQRQLISDIIKGKAPKIYNTDHGINKIKEIICCRRVLIVLDDVDDLEKITRIIGTHIPFHPGSRIIITSRHRYLISTPFISQMFGLEESCKMFEVKELAFKESLQLFKWNACCNHNSITDQNFMECCASMIVKHCGGLPLALQVLGSSLSGKSLNLWKNALEKLEAVPDGKVQKILRVSYDSLQDDHDKNLFLDIACLFIWKDRDYATTILDGCDYYTTIGIENLIGRSLLIVNENNKLVMHQLVRDMGREIIRQESTFLLKRSRLWHKDAFDVIRGKNGSQTIQCLSIDLRSGLLEDKSRRATSSLQFAKHSKYQSVMLDEVDDLETEAFAKMKSLKLLQLDYVNLKGDFKYFPKSLIWLRWHGFHLQSLPTDFHIKRLVVLEMCNSNLKHVWKDAKSLPNLKILNLNHSHNLLETPNFSRLPSLEKLLLKDCRKLTEVDQSIGELKTLTFLNLKDCGNLKKLPRTIGSLVSLQVLVLSGCSRLGDIPRELQGMTSLRELCLNETAINQPRPWLLWISKRTKELSFFWTSLPRSLVYLSLESCKLSANAMPNDLSSLPLLKSLNLSKNPIHGLPESISSLTKLDELRLNSCSELQVIPKLPIIIPLVEIYESSSPTLGLSSLPCLLSLKRCLIFGCEKLREIEGVFKLEPFENLEEEQIKSLFNTDSIDSNEVQLYNYLTDTKIVVSPQVLQECGVTSTFIQGNQVPIQFMHRTEGPRITFSLPSAHPKETISWFNICISYSLVSDQIFEFLPCVFIMNETKMTMRAYFSNFIGIPETNMDIMLWFIYWPVLGLQLEGGDSLSCMITPSGLNIRGFGITCGSENNIRYASVFPDNYPGKEEHVTRNMKLELTDENLFSLGSCGNVKVQISDRLEESKMVVSPQVLHDCGIISEFDPSKDIPFYYNDIFGPPPKVSFSMPQNSSRRIRWLKTIVILHASNNITLDFFPRIEIVNETKGTKWSHGEHFVGIPETKTSIITWLSSWKFTDELAEAGDRVSLTVLSDLRLIDTDINLVYDNDSIVNQYLSGTRCSNRFFVNVVYVLFKSRRALYRMSLLKE